MLRSLYSATSGISAQQTKLDVAANNIANVATAGFKKSTVEFTDTLSQNLKNSSGPQTGTGGVNAAQVGLGVQVGAITTQFTQGSSQATGVVTDLTIGGEGFFVVGKGVNTSYTRAGAFQIDQSGRLVTNDGGIVQGWTAVNGQVNTTSPIGAITVPSNVTARASATTLTKLEGNLPSDTAVGGKLVRDETVYDASGKASTQALTFTKTAAGWDVSDGTSTIDSLAFTNGALTSGGTGTTATGVTIDMTGLSGFAGVQSLAVSSQNGFPAGTLTSYSISNDGSIVGVFSNGQIQTLSQIAMATFTNNSGLERSGDTEFRTTSNSGPATLGTAGKGGIGALSAGTLEMSNVDLSSEMVSLITSQRALQANSRVLTTSDTVLGELIDLKR
jgi:flagellar hook protein FlgE